MIIEHDLEHDPDETYSEGQMAWHADVPFDDCPWLDDWHRRQWQAGWREAQADNGQFGVGA